MEALTKIKIFLEKKQNIAIVDAKLRSISKLIEELFKLRILVSKSIWALEEIGKGSVTPWTIPSKQSLINSIKDIVSPFYYMQ